MNKGPQLPTPLLEPLPVELPLEPVPPPLRVWEGGAVRVGASRVGLHVVVGEYENGSTPEEIVQAYDTLELTDIYAVIAYYLRHRQEVQAYLRKRAERADALQRELEARHPPLTRAELLARRAALEPGHASTGR